jgi:hypothetical protein
MDLLPMFFQRFGRGIRLEAAERVGERVLVEAPCFSRGKLDFSPAEKRSISQWALALGFPTPSAKAQDQRAIFSGALKRSSSRINAGAPTKEYVHQDML